MKGAAVAQIVAHAKQCLVMPKRLAKKKSSYKKDRSV